MVKIIVSLPVTSSPATGSGAPTAFSHWQHHRPEGAGDAVEDFSLEEERDTTDAETDAEAETEESWCP